MLFKRKERNVLFNDALNNFIYGYMATNIIFMIKDYSDIERGNPLPPLHVLLFPISSKGSFICTV